MDLWFGPRVWRRELTRYFLEYDGELGDRWEAHFLPVLDAVLSGERVLTSALQARFDFRTSAPAGVSLS